MYYLVEEYTDNCVHNSMDKAVFTALSSTQIVDGFFLKETRDIEDTIEYVAGLHHTIVSQYNVSVFVAPSPSPCVLHGINLLGEATACYSR